MSTPFIRLKFDRQEGDSYYFLAGFYNEGIDLSPGIGNFPSQHTVLEVVGKVPASLAAGTFVGLYEVPVAMSLAGIKGTPWIWQTDLIPDLLINWYDIIGYLYLDWYEVLYLPSGEVLPEPYASKEPLAETHPTLDDSYYIPKNPSQWPSDETEYQTKAIAETVSLEGCQMMSEWSSAWSGEGEWSMLTLIGNQPKLPEEPDILTRWRESHAASGMQRSEGSYDERYPQYDFDGWNSPFSNNGKIDILGGLLSQVGDLVITTSTGVIIPYLSNSRTGDQVTLKIPYALPSTPPEDNQVFVFPGTPEPSDPSGFLIPTFGALLPALYFLLTSSVSVPGQILLDNFKLSAKDIPGYGVADDTHPLADDTHPLAEEEK